MPYEPYVPEEYKSREDPATEKFDYVYHFHYTDDIESSPKKVKIPKVAVRNPAEAILALRIRNPDPDTVQAGFSCIEENRIKRRVSSVAEGSAPSWTRTSESNSTQDEANSFGHRV